jgi:acyl-CoA synthetase (AMP-forming)/AMP-acid ligase II
MGSTSPPLERYRSRGLRTDERIGWALTRARESWADRTALVCDGTRLSYLDLWRWTTAVANELVLAGLRAGDRLLWQLPNSLEALVLHLAGWRIGVLCVPVVPAYREHEMAQILVDAQPTAVAFAARQGIRAPASEMQALMDRLEIGPALRLVVGGECEGWQRLAPRPAADGRVDDGNLPPPSRAEEPCLLLYTSGTTARPKGAIHCSASLLAEAATFRSALGFSYRDVFITGAPITHIAGLLITAIIPPTVGARSVLLTAWDPDVAVALADEERATFSCGPTIFLQGFVERYERDPHPHVLSSFMCGGASIPPSLIERADRVGIRAFRSWGLTEVPTVGLIGPDDPLELRAYRDGRLSEGTEVQAVDDQRQPLPPGTRGELRVRAPEQMIGYTDAGLNEAQLDAEGWFYSGDVGLVDDDGWVTMTGRLKDIINRGGEKFSAQDIEYAIGSHPAVGSVAVTGIPDDHYGERVAAFVVLREGVSWPGRQVLLDHLEEQRLAKQKFPVVWRTLPELPMTMSGKVQKNKLVQLWEEDLHKTAEPG